MALSQLSGLDVTELNPERINVGPDGRAIPTTEPVGLRNGAGPQYNRTSFQGPPKPPISGIPAEAEAALRATPNPAMVPGAQPGLIRGGLRAAGRLLLPAALVDGALEGMGALGHKFANSRDTYDASTVPGNGYDIMTGNPVGGFAPDIGTTPAPDIRSTLDTGLRTPSGPPALPPSAAGGGRGFVNPPLADPNGPAPTNANANPEYTGGVAPAPDSTAMDRFNRASQIQAETRGLSRQLDSYGPGVHNADGTGGAAAINGTSLSADAHNRFLNESRASQHDLAVEQGLRSRNPNVQQAAIAASGQVAGNTSAERVAQLREAGETTRAVAANRARIAEANANRDVSLRGQDVTARGQDISARTAANAARIDMQQKQRAYDLDVQKFGKDVADTNLRQRESADKNLNDWLGNTFVTKDDKGNTVADKANMARFTANAQQAIGSMVQQLEQKGDPQSLAMAQQLKDRGLAALDSDARGELKTYYDRMVRHEQGRGIGPFAGSGPVSNNLLDYRLAGRDDGVIQKRLKFAGGQTIGDADLRYDELANPIAPDWFKTPITDLGPTARERASGLR